MALRDSHSILVQSPKDETTYPEAGLAPYIKDIGLIGFVVVTLAIALGKWLPSHLDERWKLRKAEIEAELASEAASRKADRDLLNTLVARTMNDASTAKEDLGTAISSIAAVLDLQSQANITLYQNFQAVSANQEKQLELLKNILTELQKHG